jgi:hypothetical protein
MASQTVNFDDGHIQYVLATKDSDESFSNRVRDLLDKGIAAEKDG